jgi:hypothetical protein
MDRSLKNVAVLALTTSMVAASATCSPAMARSSVHVPATVSPGHALVVTGAARPGTSVRLEQRLRAKWLVRASSKASTAGFRLRWIVPPSAAQIVVRVTATRGQKRLFASTPQRVNVVVPAAPPAVDKPHEVVSPVVEPPPPTTTEPATTAPAPQSDLGAGISAGTKIEAGQRLTSPTGQYELDMQDDGNLVRQCEGVRDSPARRQLRRLRRDGHGPVERRHRRSRGCCLHTAPAR